MTDIQSSLNPEQDDTLPPSTSVPIVAIGASAGDLDAFRRLFESIPEHTNLAFVVIQHLAPDHENLMIGA